MKQMAIRCYGIPLLSTGMAYCLALALTRQPSESWFMAMPIWAIVYFAINRSAWSRAKNKTIFITLPVIGLLLALLGLAIPGCTALPLEVLWAIWFFLGLAVALWGIGNIRHAWIARYTGTPRETIVKVISAMVLFIVVAPILLAVVSVHRVKYGCILDPRSAFGFDYTPLRLTTSDGMIVRGWFIPAGTSKNSVLICHGLGANKSNFIVATDFLVRNGYNVLIFDFRGHGESDGHTISMGWWEALDVRAAYDYLHRRSDNIHGLGFSMGSAALLHCAAAGAKFRSIILDSPFDNLQQMAQSRLFFIPPGLRDACAQWMLAFAVVLCQADPWQIDNVIWLKQISAPILILHGNQDNIVPEPRSRALHGKNVRRIVTQGAGHVASLLSGNPKWREMALQFLADK